MLRPDDGPLHVHQGDNSDIRGVLLVRHMDDWLVACSDRDKLIQQRDWFLALCQQISILVNLQKSELTPSTSAWYLGMVLDTVSAWVRPSQKRLDRLLLALRDFRRSDSPSVFQLLRLIGHMASIEKFTSEGRSHVRSLEFCLGDA